MSGPSLSDFIQNFQHEEQQKKLHNVVKDQMPKPKNGFLDAYKEILPAIFKQAYDPNYRLEVKLPNI